MPRRQTVWREVEIVQWPRTMLAGSVGCCPEEKTPFESLPLFWFWVLASITGAAHSSYQYSLFHLYSWNEQELDLPYPETLAPGELWVMNSVEWRTYPELLSPWWNHDSYGVIFDSEMNLLRNVSKVLFLCPSVEKGPRKYWLLESVRREDDWKRQTTAYYNSLATLSLI